jgi:hypothetical protein
MFSVTGHFKDTICEDDMTNRFKGELLLRLDDSNAADARHCFERARGHATGPG